MNTVAYIAGWGSIQNYSSNDNIDPINPNILQNVKITVLGMANCFSGSPIDDASQICAGIF